MKDANAFSQRSKSFGDRRDGRKRFGNRIRYANCSHAFLYATTAGAALA